MPDRNLFYQCIVYVMKTGNLSVYFKFHRELLNILVQGVKVRYLQITYSQLAT